MSIKHITAIVPLDILESPEKRLRDGRHPGSGEHWPSGESEQRRRCQFALVITQRA